MDSEQKGLNHPHWYDIQFGSEMPVVCVFWRIQWVSSVVHCLFFATAEICQGARCT